MTATAKATEILQLIQQDRLSPASARLKLWLKKEPDQPDAWHLMGVVHLHRESFAEGLDALDRANRLQPGNPYILNNRSVALLRLGRSADSVTSAQEALALSDADPGFWANLGYALRARRDFEGMARAFEQACRRALDDNEFLLGWATAVRQQGDSTTARAILNQATQPDRGIQLEHLVIAVLLGEEEAERRADQALTDHDLDAANALADAGCPAAALVRYRRHLERHPSDATARYLAQALEGRIAEANNADYVEQLYNDAASKFEERLLGHLDYQGPRWLAAHLAELGDPRVVWDLGCGTGLAGPVLKNQWPDVTLIGVDLSQAMLDQADKKQCYSALHQASLTDWAFPDRLAPEHRTPDLVVLMDVLIYIPNATDWLQTLMKQLPEKGRVVMTLEQGRHEQIQQQARIQHDGDAIREALAPHACVLDEAGMIRLEKGNAVEGRWLVFECRHIINEVGSIL